MKLAPVALSVVLVYGFVGHACAPSGHTSAIAQTIFTQSDHAVSTVPESTDDGGYSTQLGAFIQPGVWISARST